MKRSQDKTKPMPNNFMQKRKEKALNHRRSTSNRYTEEKETNSDEKALVSPVEEKTIPKPTEEVSQKCFQLAKQLDFLEAFTKSIEINKEEFSDTKKPLKEDSPQKDEEPLFSKIFAWGNNSSAQICTTEGFIHDPVQISLPQIKTFKQVACGHSHTLMLSEQGIVFAMGNNSKYQLGLCPDIVISKSPSQVDGLNSAVKIACGAFNSYAIEDHSLFAWGSCQALGIDQEENSWNPTKVNFQGTQTQIKSVSGGNNHAAALTKCNEMFVWGSNSHGQLALTDKMDRKTPTSCPEFIQLQVTQVSCGRDYTFVITENNEMLVSGKLPFTIEHMQIDQSIQTDFVTTFQSVAQFETGVQVVQIETSKFASILVKPGNSLEPKELFMWGETPLGLFQEPTSLNQLISECQDGASQVFDVKAMKNGQHFCVFVDETTGLTYQLGAEDLGDPLSSESQVTLSELRDARFNNQTQFACGFDFIIGSSTIEGKTPIESPSKSAKKSPPKLSPLKVLKKQKEDLSCGLQCITEEQNMSVQSSTSKKIKLVQIIETQHSDKSATSVDASDVQVMVATPTYFPDKQASNNVISEQSQMGLTGEIFREYLKPSEQTSAEKSIKKRVPSLNLAEQVKPQQIKPEQVKSEQEKPSESRTENRSRSKSNSKVARELAFNAKSPTKKSPQKMSSVKSKPPIPYKREASCDEEKMVTARESHSIGSNNPKVTPRNRLTQDAHQQSNQSLGQFKTAKDDFKNQLSDRVVGQEIRQLDYSPGVSPIQKYSQIRDSLADLTNAMGMFSNNQEDRSIFDSSRLHCRIPSEMSASAFQNNDTQHAFGCKQIAADQNYISSHGPKQQVDMQIQFSSNQQNFKNQSPLNVLNQQQRTPRSSRYLPMQQNTQMIQQLASNSSQSNLVYLPQGPNTTGQKAQEYVVRASNVQPTNLNTVFQSFTDNMSMSNMRASYCGPFVPANLDQSIHYLELEGMLVKEKVEILEHNLRDEKSKRQSLEQTHRQDLEQARSQVQDLMKQLEKAGKDYSKLLGQVDEDQEETAQLREQVRSQTSQIASLSEKLKYADEQRKEWLKLKEKLENEIKDTLYALKQAEELAKITTLNNSTMIQKHCQNDQCEQRISELEDQIYKKTSMVQDLAKRLGSIEFENKELKAELRDRTEALQDKLDQFKDIANQESNQDNERIAQLQDLVEKLQSENASLKQANAKVQEPKFISKTTNTSSPIVDLKSDNQKVKSTQRNQVVAKAETELLEFKIMESQIAKEKKRNNYVHEPSQSHFTQFTSIGEAYSENIQDHIRQSFQYFDKNIFQNKQQKKGSQNVSPKPELDDSTIQKMFDQSQNETIIDHHRQISQLQTPKVLKRAIERSGSRLKQPTPIQKSSPLKATLERMNKVVNHKPQVSSRTQSAGNPNGGLIKNRSVAELPAKKQDAISKGKNYHKNCSQNNLQTSMESGKQTKVSQSFTAGRHSFVQGKSTPTPRNVIPKQTPVIQANAGISATPRSGVVGPPMNLENRYASKTSKNIESNPELQNTQNRSPWRQQQCETQRVTYDPKRNNLISKYKTGGNNQNNVSQLSHNRTESEHQIDIKLAANISQSNTNKNLNLDFIENDFNSQQVHQLKPRKSVLLESYDQNTPNNKTALSNDSNNGLSTMKDKLKSIQDNKQMLEKKIQEYERKLQQIQKKGKQPHKMR